MSKAFASQADLAEKQVTFTKLSDNAYAYTAEGDPNTGVVIGDDAVMVIDTQATPVMAEDVIRHIRTVTDKPVKYVVTQATTTPCACSARAPTARARSSPARTRAT